VAALQAAPADALARYARFEDVLELIRARRDVKLLIDVEQGVRLARYAPGRIEFEPAPGASTDLASTLGQRLQAWTGVRWAVSVVSGGGAPSVAEARDAERSAAEERARAHPLVQEVLAAFPQARIAAIRSPEEIAGAAAADALPEAEEDDAFDPFEDD
jgi:DNA polymerase-3 subunit gamma/tau